MARLSADATAACAASKRNPQPPSETMARRRLWVRSAKGSSLNREWIAVHDASMPAKFDGTPRSDDRLRKGAANTAMASIAIGQSSRSLPRMTCRR